MKFIDDFESMKESFFPEINSFKIFVQIQSVLQPNLSIVDMLYSGHHAITDTFSWNRPNHGQTIIENPLYTGHFYSGHLL